MALAHCRLGNLEQACKLYLSELNTTPPSFTGSDEARRQFFLGRHNARLRALPGTDTRKALEASILLERGRRRLTIHPQGALADYKAAAEVAPDNWIIAEQIGEALYRLERRDEATPYYRRAAQLGGDNVPERARERAKMDE